MRNFKIKYLFITNSATGGGAERAINIVVRALQEIEVSTGLLTLNSGPADLVKINNSEFNIGREWRSGLLPTFRAGFRFFKQVKLLDPKVIIVNCELPELMAALFTSKRKIICVEHVRMPWKNRKILGLLIRILLFIKRASWVTVSPYLKPWGPVLGKTPVIRNPVSLESLSFGHLELGAIGHQIERLVFVGRLTAEQKRPEWLIRVCTSVLLPGVYVGAGNAREALELLAIQTQVQCEFRGQSINPWESWNKGDLLLVPSAWEGDGLVVVEAILLGIPLLLSDIPEFRFFGLEDKFYCADPSAFTSKIEYYRTNISSLIVPEDIRMKLRSSRDPNYIAHEWKEMLDKF